MAERNVHCFHGLKGCQCYDNYDTARAALREATERYDGLLQRYAKRAAKQALALREAEAQRDDWQSKYEYANENFNASFQAERKRAEAAERKMDEVKGAARQLDDWATLVSPVLADDDYQRLKQIREGMSDVVACPHRERAAEAQQELAEVRIGHADEYRIWVKTMNNAVAAERKRAEALEAALLRFAGDGPTIIGNEMVRHFGGCDGYECHKPHPVLDARRCRDARRALAGEPRQTYPDICLNPECPGTEEAECHTFGRVGEPEREDCPDCNSGNPVIRNSCIQSHARPEREGAER